MFLRSLIAAAVATALVAPQAAFAWSSRASVSIVLRHGPGTNYSPITVVPAGATVEVYHCAGWCEVLYLGNRGFVYGRYVGARYAPLAEPLYVSPVKTAEGTYLNPVYVPPQTAYLASAPIRSPAANRAGWYEGRAFYYPGRYINRPDLFFVYGR